MHKNDIIHGNLSLASIFIQHNGLVKIGSGKLDINLMTFSVYVSFYLSGIFISDWFKEKDTCYSKYAMKKAVIPKVV